MTRSARSFLVNEVDYEELSIIFDETFAEAKKMRRYIEIAVTTDSDVD